VAARTAVARIRLKGRSTRGAISSLSGNRVIAPPGMVAISRVSLVFFARIQHRNVSQSHYGFSSGISLAGLGSGNVLM
jgi:hypothetical protein